MNFTSLQGGAGGWCEDDASAHFYSLENKFKIAKSAKDNYNFFSIRSWPNLSRWID